MKRTGRGAAAAAASGSGELASESPPSLPARTQALSPAVRASAASPPLLTRPLSLPLPAPAVAPRRPAGKSADDIKLDLIELHNLWNSDIDDESASAFYSAAIVSAVLQIIREKAEVRKLIDGLKAWTTGTDMISTGSDSALAEPGPLVPKKFIFAVKTCLTAVLTDCP